MKNDIQSSDRSPFGFETLEVEKLLFDPKNPRLVEYLDTDNPSQDDLITVLWQKMAVDEIAYSIAASGYFPYEPVFVTEERGKLTVIEGNRRLAAVKLLRSPQLRKLVGATDLPLISETLKRSLDKIPVIRSTRKAAWRHLGFKHVNGPSKWDSYAKAEYIAQVHNEFGVPLVDIANQIGDRHNTVLRLYRALMVIRQAEKEKVWNRTRRFKPHFSFSHLYTGLDYDGIASFIRLKNEYDEATAPVPKKSLSDLKELLVWIYGDKTLDLRPMVESQNPNLRQLNEVLLSPKATEALRSNLPLSVALEISYGDAKVFHTALLQAKEHLQKARGTLSTGFDGESDLIRIGQDVFDIAADLLDEMQRKANSQKRRKG